MNNYEVLYDKIFKILGDLTPLNVDCGVLCNGACCKGNENEGMRLFPYETTTLDVRETKYGEKLVVCDGNCNRNQRPLSCRIFPFFPTVDPKGKVYVEVDWRAKNLCPLIEHSDELVFNKKFFKALKKIGKILSKDDECLKFLQKNTEEIDVYRKFLE